MTALAKHPYLSRAYFVVALELNLGREAGNIWLNTVGKFLLPDGSDRLRPIYDKYTDMRRPGIWTHGRTKVEYAMSMREHITNGTLKIAGDLVSGDMRLKESPADKARMNFEKMMMQVSRYRMVDQDSDAPLSERKSGISGVINAKGKKDASINDDLALALSFCVGMVDRLRTRDFPNFDYSVLGGGSRRV